MRVLLVTKNFPPRSCGVGDYVCCLASELAAAGESVTVLTEPAEAPRHVALGLREVPLRGWRDLSRILDAIAASAPDCVQLEYSGYAWGRWGVAWWVNALLFQLRRRGIPVRVGLHELAVSMRLHPFQAPVALAQWAHNALLIAAAETVAVNMRSRVALLERLFPWWREKIQYRPNSSTIPVVSTSPAERTAFRRARGAASDAIVVASFGLFHRAKNYEGLIQAVAHLYRFRPMQLWMLGNSAAASPEYTARLMQAARDAGIESALWWPGRLEAGDISRALQSADVFVLPQPDGHLTRSSAFMAAAAHGLPVVAVRQSGGLDQREFRHGETVWLAEFSTAAHLAAGIRALIDDPAAAKQMGTNLRSLYEKLFAWSVTATVPGSVKQGAVPVEEPGRQESVATAASAGGAKP